MAQGNAQFDSLSSPLAYLQYPLATLVLTLLAMLVLLSRSGWWTPFVLLTALYSTLPSANERRLYLFLVPLCLIAADNLSLRLAATGHSQWRRPWPWWRGVFSFACSAGLVGVLGFVVFSQILTGAGPLPRLAITAQSAVDTLSSPDWDAGFVVADGRRSLVEKLKEQSDPIVTSGWWQFPEEHIWSGVRFIDRMDLQAPERTQGAAEILLLFDPENPYWPETSVEMCETTVTRGPGYVLCTLRRDLPLNHRWGIAE